MEFDRNKHVYHNEEFVELVKDAIRFFHGTPVHQLPPKEVFKGSGVYAIYYIGNHQLYKPYANWNRLSYDVPIYVGKAVPKGWRQARISDSNLSQSTELFRRLKEHAKNIAVTSDLSPLDFMCRFVIFEGAGSDMIGTIEAALIKMYRPLWNSCIDGFGNHDPGRGRYQQAKSDWDVLHSGRAWADRLNGVHNSYESIIKKLESHLIGSEKK